MRLNKATTHAIRALVACAGRQGELLKVSELAGQLDLTQQNTFKIVHLLSRAGFLQAARGRHGGVRLSRPATEIRVGDVVRNMEELSFDGSGEPSAVVSGGARLGVIDDAFEAFLGVLNETTVADMAREAARSGKPAGRGTAKASARPSRRSAKVAKARDARRSPARV